MQLVNIARNPVPSGAVVGTFKAADGALIRFARWQATRGPRRGTIVLIPGRAEVIEKYFETIADLTRRGFAVAAMDPRGQGGSARALTNPHKGHVGDFAEYDRDAATFMREIVMPDCPPPYIGLGHSMGGHILVRCAAAYGSWFERMVLSAPMLRIHKSKLSNAQSVARVYSETSALIGLSHSYVRGGNDDPDAAVTFETNEYTSDPDRFSRNRSLHLAMGQAALGAPTIGWLRAALRSCARIEAADFTTRISVPLLFVTAGRDTIVSSLATEVFASRMKLATLVGLPTSKHEILQETDKIRGQFWATFDAYLGVQAAAA